MKIAICGKICSGKSYIANYLHQKYNFKIYSFSMGVKKYAVELFDMKEKDRKLLQLLSRNMKEIDENVWINFLDKNLKTTDQHIVIDDLRFENEYHYLKKNDFILIKLNINSDLQKKRILDTYPNNFQNHLDNLEDSSENLIDLDFDYTFNVSLNTEKNIIGFIEKILE